MVSLGDIKIIKILGSSLEIILKLEIFIVSFAFFEQLKA
jgi:hypothetical protein